MDLQQQYCGLWANEAGYVLYIESLEQNYFLVSFSPAKDHGPIARRPGDAATTARMPGRWREDEGQIVVALLGDEDGPCLFLAYNDDSDGLVPCPSAPYDPLREFVGVPWMKSLSEFHQVARDRWDDYVLLRNLGPVPAGFPKWSDRLLDRIDLFRLLQFYGPGGYETCLSDDEKTLYLAPRLVEFAGGEADGETGYPFFRLDLDQFLDLFEHVDAVAWDTMHDEMTVEGVVKGESVLVIIRKYPFEDAKATDVFDSVGLRQKRGTYPDFDE